MARPRSASCKIGLPSLSCPQTGVFIRRVEDCSPFLAGDHTRLRELLHPARQPATVRFSLAYGSLEPGRRSKRHTLSVPEVYYVLAGCGLFTVGEQMVETTAGTVVYIPGGVEQSVENIGDSLFTFLCLVDPAWTPECETVFE